MVKQSRPNASVAQAPVLLTRPAVPSARFAADLTDRFGDRVRVLISPLMRTETLFPPVQDRPYAAVVLTSEAAVLPARQMRDKGLFRADTAFCVGDRTARAAKAQGFAAVSAGGNVESLVALIHAQDPRRPLLYLHGQERAGDLEARMAAYGHEVVSAVVYRQVAQPLTDEAKSQLSRHGAIIVPLFSARSALLFGQAMPRNTPARVLVAAFSDAVASAAENFPHGEMRVAERPDATAMLEVIKQLLIVARGS